MAAAVALVLGLFVLGVLATVVTQRRTSLPDHADRGLRHDRATQAVASAAALLAAVLAGLWAWDNPAMRGGLGIPLFMTLGAGTAYVGVHVLGQLLWPRPAGAHRRASLTPRGPSDVVHPLPLRLLRVTAGVLAVAIALPAVLAPLDGPTVGRQDIYRSPWGEPPSAVNVVREVLGLGWPGLRYGLPALLMAGAVLLLTWWFLRLLADRPRVADTPTVVDEAMRRVAARRVLSAAVGTLAFAGGWFVLTTGSRLAETDPGSVPVVGLTLLALGALWATAGIIAAAVGVLWPARRLAAPAAPGRTSS